MKKRLLVMAILCILLAGCTQRDKVLQQSDIEGKYNISGSEIKAMLNDKDNSNDEMSHYNFLSHNEKVDFTLVSESFKTPLKADVSFDYAVKKNKVILSFTPEIRIETDEATNVKVLDQWSYKIIDNKLYFSSRIAFEKKVSGTVVRAIEDVILPITLFNI